MLVAVRAAAGGADLLAGEGIECHQGWDAVTGKDAGDGAGGDAGLVADRVGAGAQFQAGSVTVTPLLRKAHCPRDCPVDIGDVESSRR